MRSLCAYCLNCGWQYVDDPSVMGVHQPPARCPFCDGRMRLGWGESLPPAAKSTIRAS